MRSVHVLPAHRAVTINSANVTVRTDNRPGGRHHVIARDQRQLRRPCCEHMEVPGGGGCGGWIGTTVGPVMGHAVIGQFGASRSPGLQMGCIRPLMH